MKRQLKPRKSVLLLGCVFALAIQGASADDVKFADLKDKLTIDKSAVKSENGSLSSYAPALDKVMPAVVTVFSSRSIEMQRDPQQEELFRKMFPDIPEDFFEKRQEEGAIARKKASAPA